MTEEEKLQFVSATNIDETKDVVSAYLKIAGQKILARAYPYNPEITEVPDKYATLQCEIAVYLINKQGAEGQTAHSENSISRSYENADVPVSMLNAITPYCGVIK